MFTTAWSTYGPLSLRPEAADTSVVLQRSLCWGGWLGYS